MNFILKSALFLGLAVTALSVAACQGDRIDLQQENQSNERPVVDNAKICQDAIASVENQLNAIPKLTILQKKIYNDLRCIYGLPAQMSCNIPRQVGATYKSLWTKVKQNAKAIRLGRTKRRYKGLDQPPRFISRTCTLN